MSQPGSSIDTLIGWLNSAPLEAALKERLCASAETLSPDQVSTANSLFEASAMRLNEYYDWLSRQSETTDASLEGPESPTSQPKSDDMLSHFALNTNSIKLHSRRIKTAIDDPRISSLHFVSRSVERLETYVYSTGDYGSLINFIYHCANSLLCSINTRGTTAIELANDIVQTGIKWHPSNNALWILWAQSYVANSDYDTARIILLEAIRRQPTYSDHYHRLALLLSDRIGDHRSALSIAREGFRLSRLPSKRSNAPLITAYFDISAKVFLLEEEPSLLSEIKSLLGKCAQSNAITGLAQIISQGSSRPNILAAFIELVPHLDDPAIVDFLHEVALGSGNETAARALRERGRAVGGREPQSSAPSKNSRQFANHYSKRVASGRGFNFSVKDQLTTAKLERVPQELIDMALVREMFNSGDAVGVRALLDDLRSQRSSPRMLSYLNVLILRGGHAIAYEEPANDFAIAFERALRSGDMRTLTLLSRNTPKNAALCLVARSALGDESAFIEIERLLISGPASSMAVSASNYLQMLGVDNIKSLPQVRDQFSSRANMIEFLSSINISLI